jgi:hypothetical protein
MVRGLQSLLVLAVLCSFLARAEDVQRSPIPPASFCESFLENFQILRRSRSRQPPVANYQFDVRVIAKSPFHASFAPRELLSTAQQQVSKHLQRLRDLGFDEMPFLNVLLEAHPGAIMGLTDEGGGNFIWTPIQRRSPFLTNARELLGFKSFLGTTVFMPKIQKDRFGHYPRILILQAKESHHFIFDDSILAHEIAHLAEPFGVTHRLWLEARADFLAFLMTGQTQLKTAGDMELEKMDAAGNLRNEKITIIRDLAAPLVRNLAEVRPGTEAYHDNSLILSSFLFENYRLLGRERALELLETLDIVAQGLPEVRDARDPSKHLSHRPVFVDNKKPETVRKALQDNLKIFGLAIRKWTERNCTREERELLEASLQAREL